MPSFRLRCDMEFAGRRYSSSLLIWPECGPTALAIVAERIDYNLVRDAGVLLPNRRWTLEAFRA